MPIKPYYSPYTGSAWKSGVDFDAYDAHTPLAVNNSKFGGVSSPYREGARRLVEDLNAKPGNHILDADGRTGIWSIEAFLQYGPNIDITFTDKEPARLVLAKYKFHQIEPVNASTIKDALETSGAKLPDEQYESFANALNGAHEPRLRKLWDNFRKESAPYHNKIKFLSGDLPKIVDQISPESIDAAVAGLYIRASDPTTAKTQFGALHKVLKQGASVVWNTACASYNDARWPAAENYFMQNKLFYIFFENLAKELPFSFDNPLKVNAGMMPGKMTEADIKAYTAEAGFETEQIGTWTHGADADFQTLMRNHLAGATKSVVMQAVKDNKFQAQNLDAYIDQVFDRALQATIVHPEALLDSEHKVNVVPIFMSTKK